MSLMDWKDLLYYDESSPTGLRWKVEITSGRGNRINCSPGDVAGTDGDEVRLHYIVAYDYGQYLAHRIIYEMFHGKIPEGFTVDHIDGDGRNNRITNLRIVSHAVNMRNCKKRVDNKTGIVGVSRRISRHGTIQYSATWKYLDGKQGSKTFSASVYGNEDAFRLACEHRAKMIEKLNRQGAGYTEDHGVRQ